MAPIGHGMDPWNYSALESRELNSSSPRVRFSLISVSRSPPEIIRYNSSMPRLEGLGNIVTELRAERAHLVNNLRHVDAALAVLGKLEGGKFATASRRSLSVTARRKMAAAQKARWAKVRGQSQTAASGKTSTARRTISAAARRKIAAAQRARWAKVRASQQK
jgi:hypothetical protein